MPRSLPEWIATHPDQRVPPRVRLRIFDRFERRCQCGCNRKIAVGETWHIDHILALVNGGLHREGNMRPLLAAHHKPKTRADVRIKADGYRIRAKHAGIRFTKSRPMPGTIASGLKKKFDGTVERR